MNKLLGQHFLINTKAVDAIIAALALQKGETVVEIGPGGGALTDPLLEACAKIGCRVIAIEKDPRLVSSIKYKVSGIEIIEGDALKILPVLHTKYLIPNTEYKLVGNIPYYITGKLLRILGDMEQKPVLAVLMIQKEVAERLSAQPPKMNLLAAATQIWSATKIIVTLKPKDFDPPPEVDSAVIKLVIDAKIKENRELLAYFRLIKIIFKQPRKTVLNNLSTGLEMKKLEVLEILKKCGLTGEERPQNLSLATLQKVMHFLPLGK